MTASAATGHVVALDADGPLPQTPKSAMLARAVRAGIAVPPGVVVEPQMTGSAALERAVRQKLSAPLAVRSSFDAEDGMETSAAGRFHSELNVTFDDLSSAIQRVRTSADETVKRADVLVMTQVAATHAGVAVMEDAYLDDLVEVTDGLADQLVGGQMEGEQVLVPRLDRHLGAASGWQGRLARLLRDVREEFGTSASAGWDVEPSAGWDVEPSAGWDVEPSAGWDVEPSAGWDVEWADDGSACWLVQIRPLLRPTVRNETLTLANHAEILPDLPSDFMTSVIIECGPRLLEWYTSLDSRLPTGRDLMVERAGRPLLNASLLQDILRTWGLPTSLLADSMGGTSDTTPLSLTRMTRSIPALLRVGVRQLRSVGDAAKRGQELLELARADRSSAARGEVSASVDAAVAVYAGLVTGMFALANAHAVQVSVLSRLGLLDEVQRRSPTPAGGLARDLQAGMALDQLQERHGHRGVYESDLARPRYTERPDQLDRAREAAAVVPPHHGRSTAHGCRNPRSAAVVVGTTVPRGPRTTARHRDAGLRHRATETARRDGGSSRLGIRDRP